MGGGVAGKVSLVNMSWGGLAFSLFAFSRFSRFSEFVDGS